MRSALRMAFAAALAPAAFAAPPLLEPADAPLSEVGFADFNGDGRSDMAVRVFASGDLRISYNIGDRFSATPDWIGPARSAPDGVNWDTLFADMDGDGRADSIDRNRSDGNLCVHRNLGSDFESPGICIVFPFSRPAPRWRAFLAPMDGDARADLVSIDQQTGTIYVHRNNTVVPGVGPITSYSFDTTPLFTQTVAVPSYPTPTGWQQFLADCSGDGKADLIELNQSNNAFFCHVYGAPSDPTPFAPATGVIFQGPPEIYERELAFGQFDAGGIADVVSHDLRTGDIVVLPVLPEGDGRYTGHRALLRDRSPAYTRSAGQQPLPADAVRSIAALAWYDDDHSDNVQRPVDNGWFDLYDGYPGVANPVTNTWVYRSDTPLLLGTYASAAPKTIRQHAYWLRASGTDAVLADLTNCPRNAVPEPGETPPANGTIEWYCDEIRHTLTNYLAVTADIRDFVPPRMAVAMRIPQDKEEKEQYAEATLIADDLYAIYSTNPGAWYTYNDGSANKDKPLLLVFAKFDTPWYSAPPWTDSRFNIRYTNGYLEFNGFTTADSASSSYIAGDLPYWNFVENTVDTTRPPGYYRNVYRRVPTDTTQAEQSSVWTSLWLGCDEFGCKNWDGQQEVRDSKITVDRLAEPLYAKPPRNVTIGRFNYPIVWLEQPQEGISTDESSYFEPSDHTGWTIYDKVSNVAYNLKKQRKGAPGRPVVTYRDGATATVAFQSANYPTQYCTSVTKECPADGWLVVDVRTTCLIQPTLTTPPPVDLPPPVGSLVTGAFYLRTRNPFGDSDAVLVSGNVGMTPAGCP